MLDLQNQGYTLKTLNIAIAQLYNFMLKGNNQAAKFNMVETKKISRQSSFLSSLLSSFGSSVFKLLWLSNNSRLVPDESRISELLGRP